MIKGRGESAVEEEVSREDRHHKNSTGHSIQVDEGMGLLC